MATEVAIAIIGLFQAVTLAVLGIISSRVSRVRKDAHATKEQIVNHHNPQPNFRDENDSRHAETKRWFSGLSQLVRSMERSLNARLDNVEGVVSELIETGSENRSRIIGLEDTERTRQRKLNGG